MTAKRYSAGAIFLQVVPVFANVQRAIEDEAKTIDRALGDQMERSGERAGERAGKAASKRMSEEIKRADIGKDFERQIHAATADIEKALGDIDTKNLGKKLRGEMKEMRAELKALSDIDINVDDNLEKVRARVEAVKASIEDMRSRSKVFFDIKGLPQVYRDLSKVQATIDAIDGDINVDVDTRGAERSMGAFEKKFKATSKRAAESLSSSVHREAQKATADLEYLSNLRIGIDISSTMARRELGEIKRELEVLTTEDNDIDLRVDSNAAMREIVAFEAILEKLDGEDVEVDVKTNSRRAGRDAQDAANSFRSFNIVLLAAASIGPALIPILAGIAGGLLALGPAAAIAVAGIGSVLVGFSGLGDAVTALQNQQDQAATTAQQAAKSQVSSARAIEDAQEALSDARRAAGRAAEDAAKAVKDAREAAADAIEEALDRQKDAQEDYRDAVNDVADAEQSLRDAREDARKDAESLAKRQRQNAVDERQGVLDLFEAQTKYNAVMADGSSTDTDKEQASVNLEQAQIALNDTRDEQVALADEAADYAKNGVDGSDKVKDAQDDVTAALEAQKEAQEAVKDAAEEADEVRIEGAERVKEALEDQRETLSDNARAISRAKEALSDARNQAVEDLSAINSQQQAVNAAFDKLGPAGRKFALFLFGLKSGFYEFRDAVQEAMLPSVQKAIEGFIASPAADKARGAFVALAAAFGDFALALSDSFQGTAWTEFFEMLADLGPKIYDAYGGAFIKLFEALASIFTTAAPFALLFARGVEKMMDGFANWAASKKGQDALLNFIDYVKEVGPAVLEFFGSLITTFVHIVRAMAPFGEVVLAVLDAFLGFIAGMDEGVLGALLTGLTIIILASQVAYAVMNLAMSLGALFATTMGPWIFLIVAIAAALIYLYQTNETFRDFINEAWKEISAVLKDSWENILKPALMEMWAAFQDLWDQVLAPFFKWLAPIILWIVKKIIPALALEFAVTAAVITWVIEKVLIPVLKFMGDAFLTLFNAAKWAWENIGKPIWDAITTATSWLWENVFKPVFGAIWTVISTTFNAIKAIWENVLWPIISTIGKVVMHLAKGIFKVAFVLILAAAKSVFIGIKALWNNVLSPVLGWIGEKASWLWEKAFKPALGWISRTWADMTNGLKTKWDKYGQPIFDWIAEHALPPLQTAFEDTIAAIGDLWEGLKQLVGTPIKFVIEKIINEGIIDGFNKIANWVGQDGFDHIKTPDWMKGYATGGILPGYTPGRDVHTFRSPTAGTLNLSGGEAIMRPEWTAAMGPDYVNQMNGLARSGGTGAIRKAMGMGSYWLGGILPLPGGSAKSHGSSYSYPAYDLNWGSGYDDYGRPVVAWKDGLISSMPYLGDDSYGRYVTLDHGGQTTLYAHLSGFANALATNMRVAAGDTLGYVGDLGNTGTPPTSHLHFEIRGGAPDFSDSDTTTKSRPKIPSWLLGFVKDPLSGFKNWITEPLKQASEAMQSPFFDGLSKVPGRLGKKVVDKAWDVIPGWVKTAAGWASDAGGWVVGGVKSAANATHDALEATGNAVGHGIGAVGDFLGFEKGGILPYNGAMMYDNGGYLAPGLTTVMNLTGKPEPVFTADQFDNLGVGAGGDGFTYAPTINGSDLTAADIVDDMDFQRRKIRREGKYGRNL